MTQTSPYEPDRLLAWSIIAALGRNSLDAYSELYSIAFSVALIISISSLPISVPLCVCHEVETAPKFLCGESCLRQTLKCNPCESSTNCLREEIS